MRKNHLFILILLCSFIGISCVYKNISVDTLSRYGSRGTEVRQIQTKLKNWGYYKGSVDGIFGYQTYQAVRYFQSKNGLSVDGIAGPQTLAAMGISSSSSSLTSSANLLARLISAEAKGEPYLGQVAVGAVIMNRVNDSRFPNTIPGVIYQSGAFQPVQNGTINNAPVSSAIKAANEALAGYDPSGNAIYFFNPKTSTSKWIWSRTVVKVIGNHYFAI